MSDYQAFPPDMIEAVASIIGETNSGLSGNEIALVLGQCAIEEVEPGASKWKRLYAALCRAQAQTGDGEAVVAFIHQVMKPARWLRQGAQLETMRANLNQALSLYGFTLGEDGVLSEVQATQTLAEAEKRAHRLESLLIARCVHKDVLDFCRPELLQDNYFHAVLEATKSVAEKIRSLSGLPDDGAPLVQAAFGIGENGPVLAINALATKPQEGEQKAFVNLLVGLFGMFRNPPAHAPRIYWSVDEQDALDILSLLSLVQRKLDGTRRISMPQR